MSELRIKNRRESDLRSCEVTHSDFFLGFVCNCLSYFTTAKITFSSKALCDIMTGAFYLRQVIHRLLKSVDDNLFQEH